MNGFVAYEPTRDLDIGAVAEKSRIPRRKRMVGRVRIPPQMVLNRSCPLRISQSFTDREQMETRSSINARQGRNEPSIDKHQTRTFMGVKFRNRYQPAIDRRLKCDAANRSHIRVLPILQFRCREAECEEVVHS